MARIPPILCQIKNAQSHSEQATALRSLKDEIVGHVQQKEKWVEYGVLESIVQILQNARSPAKWNGKETRAHVGPTAASLSGEESARLQALQLLASFAKGGPSFIAPIRAAGAIPAILSNICPVDNHPKLVLAALRALNSLAEAASLAAPPYEDATSLAETLFTTRYLDSIRAILEQDSAAITFREQKSLVQGLITRLCQDVRHQNALANAGILDALATILASFVVSRGEVVPSAEDQDDGMAERMPHPAPPQAKLSETLAAIATIIEDSRFRACMLLCSPAIMAVFPNMTFSPVSMSSFGMQTAWNTLELAGLSSMRPKGPGAMDYLLPVVPVYQSKSAGYNHPQYTPSSSLHNSSDNLQRLAFTVWDPNFHETTSSNEEDVDDGESPLIPWLMHLVRSTTGLDRVLAASILASLFSSGFASSEREAYIGLVIVPILCQIMKGFDKENDNDGLDSTFVNTETASEWAIMERTPAVLARLIAESEFLQQAAYDSAMAKVVCKMLKRTYAPMVSQSAPRPWSPSPDRRHERTGEGLATNRVGPPGLLPVVAHRIKMRESTLKLIASLCSFKKEIRDAIVEMDSMPYIVESLVPCPGKPKSAKDRPKAEKGAIDDSVLASGNSPYGNNPSSVIIAACHVVRSLGRSINIIRTVLEDYAVASPIFALLKHPDLSVQIAACATVCNLVTEVSPMKTPLINAGILDVLCEHAHSMSPGLRLNSMWALKHLVEARDLELKKRALEQLGSGWLDQLITNDTEDDALFARIRRRQAMATDEEDEDMGGEGFDDENKPWIWPALSHSSHGKSGAGAGSASRPIPLRMQQAERKLNALRDSELNPVRKARNDDLAIQEQGLDFIRNLIGLPTATEPNPETADLPDMVDHIFDQLGQDHFFKILSDKLRIKVLHAFARRNSGGGRGVNDSRVVYPQAKLIEAVVMILVHMAASVPRHRQLVVAQTELLRLLQQHFSSKDTNVRKSLCHLLNNLAWQDDSSDADDCAQRTHELRKLGFLAKLETLEQADRELDVRERAREAVYQLKKPPSR